MNKQETIDLLTKPHLPQILAWHNGPLYPFFAGLNLKELVAMRKEKLNSENYKYYNASARKVYHQHLKILEHCIYILLAEPLPHTALYMLENDKTCQARQLKYLNSLRIDLYEVNQEFE